MRRIEEVQRLVLEGARPLPGEVVALTAGLGRVLSADVLAPESTPPWACSAMDGFAVRSVDVAGATPQSPVLLSVTDAVMAGGVAEKSVTPGTCVRIMTGAPLPEGADAVVIIEDTDARDAGATDQVRVLAAEASGANVRPAGDDVRRGELLLAAGRTLGAGELGLLASQGLAQVLVTQRPVVAVLSTGDEVVPPGWPLGPGQIHSSNGAALGALVEEAGGAVLDCGVAPDDVQALGEHLARAARADLILTTGGVSVGDLDLVRGVLQQHGEVALWRVAMKPGKPLAYGALFGRPFFGLPGNPVSCMVNFHQFVRPLVRRLLGDPAPFLPLLAAVLDAPLAKQPGRALLARARLRRDGPIFVATPAPNQSSGALRSMADADGYVVLAVEDGGRRAGDPVQVQVLRWGWLQAAGPGWPWEQP